MKKLTDFPITDRWPAKDPSVLQLYSFPTPNGVKIPIALEETGLPYEAHLVNIMEGETTTEPFLSLNPNNKIPAIIDPNGPNGQPLALWESGAILLYLADKTGQLLPTDPPRRQQAIQWLFWQVGGLGPMAGQLGFFHKFAGREIEDSRPRDRYAGETKRLLGVLDRCLDGAEWIAGEFSVADIAIAPWVGTIRDFYEAGPIVGWDDLKHVPAYLDRFAARPAVQKGRNIPPRP